MPNWCSNEICIAGPPLDVEKAITILRELGFSGPESEPDVEYHWRPA